MSEPETPPADSQNAAPTAASDSAPPADSAAPSVSPAAAGFDDLRRKLLEQFSGLGEQVDTLQSKLAADLAQATAQARSVIEKEIAQVKEQYPDAMHRIHELRDVGEEGWGVLRGRLDRLAGDLEKALGGFVSALSDAVKRQGGTGTHAEATTDATSGSSASTATSASDPSAAASPTGSASESAASSDKSSLAS